jgi:hypothetical protein
VSLDNLVTIKRAVELLGLTKRAIEGKIYRGQWVDGRQFHRDPGGQIWIDLRGVQNWVLAK